MAYSDNEALMLDSGIEQSRFCNFGDCIGLDLRYVTTETGDDVAIVDIYDTKPISEGAEPELVRSIPQGEFTLFLASVKAADWSQPVTGYRLMDSLLPEPGQYEKFSGSEHGMFLAAAREGQFDHLGDLDAFEASGYSIAPLAGRLALFRDGAPYAA